ncbi:MAG: hypothetical protein GX281_04790 [Bacteroidales bacterium]|jgi:hypothetical protein|nr:hypothetical protein [Bacteroidales bacterium]HKM31839.1 hypothetical protein [Bacteroidales bacterium]
MKKLFSIWIMFAGLLVVSCGTSYHTASSAYDDATYLRPGVTARVHLFATAQEAEELKNKTLEQAGREGTRVETVYTDPEGTVDIDVKSGTTYLIMNTQDDSYERKLEMFNDNPEDNFSLTINMNFAMDDWYYGSWYGYGPYNYWGYYSHWYSPYWHNPWWYSPHWHNPWWYSPYRFSSYWYLPYWYYDWYYPGWGYGFSYYNPYNPYHNPYPPYQANRHNKPTYGTDNRNARRVTPGDKMNPAGTSSGTASATSRSGGSYRRVNPQINQVSGAREESVRETGKATEYSRVNRTTNQATGSGAVYREGTDGAVSRTEQSAGENTFYRRSSNASKNTTTTTTNPGNSRSFYREGQRSSTTVNQRNNSESGVRSNSGTSRSSTSTTRSNTSTTESRSSSYRSNTSSGNAAVSGTRSSVSSGSRSSYSGSTSGSTGTTSSRSGSSYHRR